MRLSGCPKRIEREACGRSGLELLETSWQDRLARGGGCADRFASGRRFSRGSARLRRVPIG